MISKSLKAILNCSRKFSTSKIFNSPLEAIYDINDGSTVAMGGFGIAGIPENGVLALIEKGTKKLKIISNVAGITDWGIGLLLEKFQVSDMFASYVGENARFEKQFLEGNVGFNMIPQGSLVEKCRDSSAGIPAFYAKAGLNTYIEDGGFPTKVDPKTKAPCSVLQPKERRDFVDTNYMLEEILYPDFALIKAYQADKKGNLRFRKTARNFNPDMAGCAPITIAEVEHIVDELPPDQVHFPGCFVDRVYKAPKVFHKIERLRIRKPGQAAKISENPKDRVRDFIAKRAAKEIKDGMYANLGAGIPMSVSNIVEGKVQVDLQGENGLVCIGPYPLEHEVDADVINAGKESVTTKPGYSISRSSDAFGMMRGKHIHLTMLGALQVSQHGDLANWIIPKQKVKGMGGAMDLVSCGSEVVIAMEHNSPKGEPKVVKDCTIPLTGKGIVTTLVTEKAVFRFKPEGMILVEIAKNLTVDELRKCTTAEFIVSPDLKEIEDD